MKDIKFYADKSDFYIRELLRKYGKIDRVAFKAGISKHTLRSIYYKRTKRIFADTFGALEHAYIKAYPKQNLDYR